MIEIKELSKWYGDFTAVNQISLSIKPGEIFAFLGMNGAGKTTTIRMMTGILQPSSGEIRLGDFDVTRNPIEAKRITGYIPDRPYLYNKLTGREFLYFICELYQIDAHEAEKAIDYVLNEYALTDWQDELTESYSHGMKQRLATCAALVHKPQLLILDEPMVGLDPHGARLLKDNLAKYAKSGMTVFLSTHSLDVAEELADRMAIIHKGAIISVGNLDQIRAQVGSMNYDLEQLFLEITTTALK